MTYVAVPALLILAVVLADNHRCPKGRHHRADDVSPREPKRLTRAFSLFLNLVKDDSLAEYFWVWMDFA